MMINTLRPLNIYEVLDLSFTSGKIRISLFVSLEQSIESEQSGKLMFTIPRQEILVSMSYKLVQICSMLILSAVFI